MELFKSMLFEIIYTTAMKTVVRTAYFSYSRTQTEGLFDIIHVYEQANR